MNLPLKRKLLAIGSSLFYFGTIVGICITSAMLIKKAYFDYIYVSGSSMNPTLTGGRGSEALPPYVNSDGEYISGDLVHFGTVDPTIRAKRNIKRYDIVTTYYPGEDYDSKGKVLKNAAYKIKRVIALPGETFKIEQGELYVLNGDAFQHVARSHLIDDGGNKTVKDISTRTLGKNEYWVMGDHRNASKDCVTINRPVTIDNITGVLVTIEGLAEYYVHYECKSCGHEVDDKEFLLGHIIQCDKCGGQIVSGDSDIRNRQYTYPRIV